MRELLEMKLEPQGAIGLFFMMVFVFYTVLISSEQEAH